MVEETGIDNIAELVTVRPDRMDQVHLSASHDGTVLNIEEAGAGGDGT